MNNFKINGTDPDNIMSKGQQVDRIYSKGTLVWEKSFPEVTIGTQTWKVKNLDVDDGGDGIANTDLDIVEEYGRYYKLEAALRIAASIDGWHVPTLGEWDILINYLGGYNSTTAASLKATGTEYWNTANGTNTSGFNLKGAGYTFADNPSYFDLKNKAHMITATPYEYREENYPDYHMILPVFDDNRIYGDYYFSGNYHPVRLIKDYPHTPTITLLGGSSVTISVGDTYTDAGATAHDTRYGDITSDIVVVNNVNTSVAGTYTVTYNITTEDGYSAEEVVRVVNVIEAEEWTYEGVMTVGEYNDPNGLFTTIGCSGVYSNNHYDYFLGQLTPNPNFANEDYVTFNFNHVFSDTYGWNKLTVDFYNENDSGIELIGDVLFNIAGTTYTLTYSSIGIYEVVTNTPFPPVGQTCEIKLRYTLAPEPTYPEVTIGTQTWMSVNLDIDDEQGGIYAYDDDEGNVATYGRLYTWDAAVRVAASVDGWHLPTDAEWTVLTDYLGGLSVAGGKLKEAGTEHWNTPNGGATNEYGFTALPSGNRSNNGTFNNIGFSGYWWSATESSATNAWYRYVYYSSSSVNRHGNNKESGYSVRLIRD